MCISRRRRGSVIFYVPDDVPKTPDALRSFLRDISDDETLEHETFKNHYQAAMSELHYVPEIQLLELVSAALADNSTRLELLKPFYAMCFIELISLSFLHTVTSMIQNVTSMTVFCHQAKKAHITKEIFITFLL